MKKSFHQIISWPSVYLKPDSGNTFSENFAPHYIRNLPIYQFSSRIRVVVWWPNTGYQEKTLVPENATPLPEENCCLINTKELALAKKIGMHPRKTKMSPKEGPFQQENRLPNIMFWGGIRYSLLFRGPVILYHLEWLSIFHEFWLLDLKKPSSYRSKIGVPKNETANCLTILLMEESCTWDAKKTCK